MNAANGPQQPDRPVVLLVEDRKENLRAMLDVFDRSGFRARGATTVEEALAASSDGGVDLCVTDVCLESTGDDRSGIQLAGMLRERYPGLPVVAYSAVFEEEDLAPHDRAEFEVVMPKKGWSPQHLEQLIDHLLRLAMEYRRTRPSDAERPPEMERVIEKLRGFSQASPLVPAVGLFVGVNAEDSQYPLPAAPADASDMIRYFQGSDPNGEWDLLGDVEDRPARRREVLLGVHRLAERVRPGHVGLFFFAGHAVADARDLILSTADFHEDHAVDTGVSLRRVLDILEVRAPDRASFLVMLDCCRRGSAEWPLDRPPKNVTLLYACSAGGVSLEGTNGGVLVQAFLDALEDTTGHGDDWGCTRSLKTVYDGLAARMAALSNHRAAAPELHGNGERDIHLPIKEWSSQRPALRGPVPTCRIRSRPLENEQTRQTMARAFLELVGQQTAMPTIQEALLEGHLDKEEDRLVVQFLGDDETEVFRRLPSRLAGLFPKQFAEITMHWSAPLEDALFQQLANQLKLEWRSLEDGCLLSWRIDERDGQVSVKRSLEGETIALLRCVSQEGRPLGLERLGSQIDEIVDRLRWIALKPGGNENV